ncbi:hypothetical protein EAY64_05900 [Aquitalea palustris]|uniref:Uncharacterized protein n=1 Tax=Aquitalea palustris TaxID=2480983 RepID=A0A454JKW5_9NEIS|nr:hypothetical protein [Aquitalea palustris]RMD00001.1 hypothetical protein EAY64_05900 [Aquitalea palustris]
MKISPIKATAAILILALLYSQTDKAIAKLFINHGQISIIFLKTCSYDAFYIENENNQILATSMYSEIPVNGPIFKENTFIPLEKLLDIKIKSNTIYNLYANTECLPNRQIPRKHFKFKIRSNGEINILDEN